MEIWQRGEEARQWILETDERERGAACGNVLQQTLMPGTVGEEGLWALGVVQRAVAHAAPRRADGQAAAVKQVARAGSGTWLLR